MVAWDIEKKQILPFQILTTRKRKDADINEIKVTKSSAPQVVTLVSGLKLEKWQEMEDLSTFFNYPH